MVYLVHTSGGYREEETPCSISNQEAKLFIADDTLPYWDGNVGRRRFCVFLQSIQSLTQSEPLSNIKYTNCSLSQVINISVFISLHVSV